MNTLFKKHFWIITLAGLALLALVTSGMVNDVVAGKLFLMPAARFVEPKAEDAATAPTLGRVAEGVNAASDLTQRRAFNLDEPAPIVVEAAPPTEQPTEVVEAPSNTLEESQLPIDLMGTYVSSLPDYSYATLQIQGENKIASLGSEYLEGKARVVKIAPGHIVLKEDARYTYVRVWHKTAAAGGAGAPMNPGMGMAPPMKPPPMTAPGVPTEPVADAGAPKTGDDISQGVTKTGAYDYTLDRAMLDNQLKDLPRLQQDGRVVPHYKDNQYQGFKLVGVRPGSLYRSIGIRSGDVIMAVNGNKIDSPNKALELFEQLKSSSNISVEIERRGQPKTLSYTIK
jgi:general secretion pathway protein C